MITMKKRHPHRLILALSVISFAASAADQGTRVNITATVVAPPPCVINEGRTIDVDFGKVGVNRIDGTRYMQRLNYSIKCEFLDNTRQLKMKIMGTGAAFDAHVLNSNISGLGIKLLADGKAFNINTPLSIDYTKPPTLDAVPVKSSALALKDGDFTSGATMLVDYF
ncbi:fimbrial protein [Pseudomonas lundensis]|uniref:fimbrial protein n=1 Tax=Serratia proteamaculans TaxID=28151 RepID=UPI0029822E54|nr:fimbrial protein [Serratia proteamaculans]MDW5500123.1 fimbrial protein [Serratia proteamaculans]MDW5505189.1 fimbrial protein [Pseudomonas lundensis]